MGGGALGEALPCRRTGSAGESRWPGRAQVSSCICWAGEDHGETREEQEASSYRCSGTGELHLCLPWRWLRAGADPLGQNFWVRSGDQLGKVIRWELQHQINGLISLIAVASKEGRNRE